MPVQGFTLAMAAACPRASTARPGERHPQHHAEDAERLSAARQRHEAAGGDARLRLCLCLRIGAAARGKPGGQPRLPVRPHWVRRGRRGRQNGPVDRFERPNAPSPREGPEGGLGFGAVTAKGGQAAIR